MARLFVIILVFVCIIAGIYSYFFIQKHNSEVNITTFEQCAAKYPVMESYPPQCTTPNGKHFTQNIGNELEYADLILVSSPRPNEKVSSPLIVSGKARGNWFFEASAPVEILDANGKSLGSGVIQATGEWMTEEFVEFKGTIQFQKPTTATGTLILRNDNPSGLLENAKEMKIPLKF